MCSCWMSTKQATHMTGIMTGMPCLSSIPLVTWLGVGLGVRVGVRVGVEVKG